VKLATSLILSLSLFLFSCHIAFFTSKTKLFLLICFIVHYVAQKGLKPNASFKPKGNRNFKLQNSGLIVFFLFTNSLKIQATIFSVSFSSLSHIRAKAVVCGCGINVFYVTKLFAREQT